MADRLLDAQVGVLGSMLIDAEAVGVVMAQVSAEDFPVAEYRVIFEAARQLFTAGKPVDAVTVNTALGGGHDKTLIDLMDLTPTSANLGAYIELLRQEARLCRLRALGLQVSQGRDIEEIRAGVEKASEELCERSGLRIVSLEDGLRSFYRRHADGAPLRALPWDFGLAHELVVEAGKYGIIGARPSAGKTALALQEAVSQASAFKVGFFSLETDADRLVDRLVANFANVPFSDIVHRKMKDDDCEKTAELASVLRGRQLEVIPASSMTVADIRAITMARQYEVVYIDYLQLIRPPAGTRNRERFAVVTDISLDLHRLAQDTGAIVIALSQLTRPERKKNGTEKEPTLADLRESGQIEQDADFVLLLSEEYPGMRNGKRLIHIAKNKDGERGGRLYLNFDGEHQNFSRSAKQWVPPKEEPEEKQVTFAELADDDPNDPFRRSK